MSRSPVVDFHVHLGKRETWLPWVNEFFDRYGDKSGPDIDDLMEPEPLAQYMKSEGVDYTVVLAEINPLTTGTVTNEYTVEFCREQSSLIPFASINPYVMLTPGQVVEHCVKDLGCRGVKLLPSYMWFYPNDKMLYPVYEKAQALGIPVMVHTGSSVFKGTRLKYADPIYLDDVAVDFPDLTLLLVHSGRGFWYDKAFFMAQLHENVCLEIAGLPPQNLLRYFPRLENLAHKVIFGSDWPGCPSISGNIQSIRALPLSDEAKEAILGGNAARILGLPPKVEAPK